MVQSQSQCKVKVALGKVREKEFKGLNTYTRNTQAIQVQRGGGH